MTAISVFERGVIHSTVRVAALIRNGIAVVDFSSGTVEYLNCDVPKTPITAIYATSDGQTDEIHYSHKSRLILNDNI